MLLQVQTKAVKGRRLPSQHWLMLQEADLILESIEAFKDELKHGVEVVRAWGGYKNIGIAGKKVSGSLARARGHFFFK